MKQTLEDIVRSNKVYEDTYTTESFEVQEWNVFFRKRAKIDEMFKPVNSKLHLVNNKVSELMAAMWHHFSKVAVQETCMVAAKLTNNEMRHYAIQTVFEELGMRNSDMIHPDLFLDAMESIGICPRGMKKAKNNYLSKFPFDLLSKNVSETFDDCELLGLLLGLEINAEENISTLSLLLAPSSDKQELINKTKFFRIHNLIEEEHIRLNIANFLRFCPDETTKEQFIKGFDNSILYWNMFWREIENGIGDLTKQ